MAKYLVPVLVASILLNVPKFVETSVGYDEFTGEVSSVSIMYSNEVGKLSRY